MAKVPTRALQLLLGDPRSGKDAVAASLRGSEATSSPWTGLGYQYFNVKDPQDQGVRPSQTSGLHQVLTCIFM